MRKFPFVRQRDGMQCGPACLSMICAYYGKTYSLSVLSRLTSVTREGVSLAALDDAAKKLGFDTCCGKIDIVDIQNEDLPCILFWGGNHFVVLYRINKDKVYIADPAKGKIELSYSEFADKWVCDYEGGLKRGIALFLEKTNGFGHFKGHEEKNVATDVLTSNFKKYGSYFSIVIFGLIVTSLMQLILPFMMQWIVDIGIKGRNLSIVWLILLGELFLILGRISTDFIRRRILLHISMKINVSLIGDFFVKLLRLPMGYFDTKLTGDLIQRIGDHSRIQSFMTSECLGILLSLLNFIIFGVVLAIYSIKIIVIYLLGALIYTLWSISFLRRRRILDYDMFEKQSANQEKVYQFVGAIQEIKLQGCQIRRRKEWEQTQSELFDIQMKILSMQQKQDTGNVLINEIVGILITVVTASAVINGNLSLGAMMAIQYLAGQMSAPVAQIISFIYGLQDVCISLDRINEIRSGVDEDKSGGLTEIPPKSAITLRRVNFKYDKYADNFTLKDINVEIPFGKTTAIVGASGSGKTTILKLLLNYYSPLEGNIYLGINDIGNYNSDYWRSKCGVVMQDGVIFSESIARNIAVGDENIDNERMIYASKIANIHDFIMELPLKFNTVIGNEGTGLSLGQKQRILIARAIYKNPDFIFLDEATNSLDADNEKVIVNNLKEFKKGRTMVVVAHRLSTVKDADTIIVLDQGQIAEQGRHADLIKKKGIYYNLVKNQLELGL